MGLLGADPGGEPWFNRTLTQMLAEGIMVDGNQIATDNAAPAGRATTYGYHSTTSSVYFAKGNFGNQGTMTVGWANYNSSNAWANTTEIFTFADVGTHQIEIRTNGSGQLYITRNGTTVGSASTNVLTTGWHYFEITVVFATGATGSVLVKVDGVTFLNLTSVQTSSTANAYTNRFYIQPIVGNFAQWYKDIYWRSDSTMMGDTTVNVCYAASAGPSQQFSPSAGTQVACVQDGITHTGTWPNDSDYIFDSNSGDVSDFAPQNVTVPGGGSIKAVIHGSRLSGDVAGATAQQYTKSGSTVHTTSTITLGTSPSYYFDVMETDPNTGSAFTQSGFNASTHGVKRP
ncbi:MAG TPA: hypothetical protein VNZ26_11290 [Vicinamibacterales bacterium]|jgi:hypothetical protein|nr:hypothetical protein [Vicinamibacterales bacterium]